MKLKFSLLALAIILATALALSLFLLMPKSYSNAALIFPGFPSFPGVGLNFGDTLIGGKIEKSERCDVLCTESFQGRLIKVSDPKAGTFVTDFGSKVYRENDFSKGNWVLGTAKNEKKECKGVTKKKAAAAIIRCFFGDCDPKNACADHGTGQIIDIIGTSK